MSKNIFFSLNFALYPCGRGQAPAGIPVVVSRCRGLSCSSSRSSSTGACARSSSQVFSLAHTRPLRRRRRSVFAADCSRFLSQRAASKASDVRAPAQVGVGGTVIAWSAARQDAEVPLQRRHSRRRRHHRAPLDGPSAKRALRATRHAAAHFARRAARSRSRVATSSSLCCRRLGTRAAHSHPGQTTNSRPFTTGSATGGATTFSTTVPSSTARRGVCAAAVGHSCARSRAAPRLHRRRRTPHHFLRFCHHRHQRCPLQALQPTRLRRTLLRTLHRTLHRTLRRKRQRTLRRKRRRRRRQRQFQRRRRRRRRLR